MYILSEITSVFAWGNEERRRAELLWQRSVARLAECESPRKPPKSTWIEATNTLFNEMEFDIRIQTPRFNVQPFGIDPEREKTNPHYAILTCREKCVLKLHELKIERSDDRVASMHFIDVGSSITRSSVHYPNVGKIGCLTKSQNIWVASLQRPLLPEEMMQFQGMIHGDLRGGHFACTPPEDCCERVFYNAKLHGHNGLAFAVPWLHKRFSLIGVAV